MIQLNESKQFPCSRFFSFLPGSAKRNRHSARRPRNITFSLITCCEYESATGGGCGLGDEQTSPLSCKLRKKGKKKGRQGVERKGGAGRCGAPPLSGAGMALGFPGWGAWPGLGTSWTWSEERLGRDKRVALAGAVAGRPGLAALPRRMHPRTHRYAYYTTQTRHA